MSDILQTLQRRHQEKVGQFQRGEVDGAWLDGIQLLIADLRQAGAAVAAPAERGQLRALMHFWGNVVYDHTGVYPDTALHPPDPERAALPAEPPARRPPPPWVWTLVGGAAVIVIVVGLVVIGQLVRPDESAPIEAAAPFLSHVAVGAGPSSNGVVEGTADILCPNTPEIFAEIALEGLEPETEWRWEVRRDGKVLAEQPAAPWGSETQHNAIRILTGGPEGVPPGEYELLVYAGDRVAGAHSFQVLDTAPRLFNLLVTDVPEPTEPTSDTGAFPDGLRVIYLSYEYEGFCPGVDVSHILYHEGEQAQQRVETWGDAPQGEARVSFQAPSDLPFSAGNYWIAALVEGQEQGRVEFAIGEQEPVEVLPDPAFGDITIALGVQPDGAPIITRTDSVFDWNTKVVYSIFDYVGMRDGLQWAAVWMLNGREVAREEHLWDVKTDGVAGTRWVAHYDELGQVLYGGSYSVTLYIDNVPQRTADFSLLYYVPQPQ